MAILAVIPARYASVRFPGKPLALIGDKPMIQHVWERCRQAEGIDQVIVATEDERIRAACSRFGAVCELTSANHASGTDRVAEVAVRHPEFTVVLNVQGDEPAMDPLTVSRVAGAFADASVRIATAVFPVSDSTGLDDPNVVKAVLDLSGRALYFSRACIPFLRDSAAAVRPTYYRHLGIYGFRRETLLDVTRLAVSPLERAESLEQLRWLQAGHAIQCVEAARYSVGVDTPHDLAALAQSLQS